jgi:hypothetical protein
MDKPFDTIKQLVADFKAQEAAYLAPARPGKSIVPSEEYFVFGRTDTEKNQPELLGQDRQIREAADELYGLTEEEVKTEVVKRP